MGGSGLELRGLAARGLGAPGWVLLGKGHELEGLRSSPDFTVW